MINTTVNICGVEFKNPIIAASGTFGVGREYNEYFDISRLGGISTLGVTYNSRPGNKGIRIYETPSGMINSIGLENPGVKAFIEKEIPFLESLDTKILVNVSGSHIEEYLKIIEEINDTNVDFIELNISCPNVKEGGMAFGIKCDSAFDIVTQSKKISKKPMIVKLSPNAEDIIEMGIACEEAGADGLSLVNTFKAMAIDIENKRPVFDNVTAGLSGPAIKPIALRMVYEVCKNVNIPVIGLGGIMNYKDVIEYIMAGATAVQIGSGIFTDPLLMVKIIEDLENYMRKNNIKNLEEIRGII